MKILVIFLISSLIGLASPPLPADVDVWLVAHPNVSNAIKWQTVNGTGANGLYVVPEAAKLAYPNWSASEKQELIDAFSYAYQWYFFHYGQASWGDTIDIIPTNQLALSPNQTPVCYVTESYARQLFIRLVAHALLLEIYQLVPWSITTYTDTQLDDLLDSSRFMKKTVLGVFMGGFDNPFYEPERKDVLGNVLIAPPIYTYKFLRSNSIMPDSGIQAVQKIQVIKNLLTWCRNNMTHFYGSETCQNFQAHWQFFGPAPFARIAEGTHYVNQNGIDYGFSHWTPGCKGTSAFISHALRSVNIPIEQSFVCTGAHSIPIFPTESVFLDHGDNPYNSAFKSSGLPVDVLLNDASLFQTLFGIPFSSSLNPYASSCDGVGYSINNLFQ